MKNIGRKPYDLASIGHDHTLLMLSLPEKCQRECISNLNFSSYYFSTDKWIK